MVYQDTDGLLDLPLPKLIGRHQIDNAALAIAALRRIGGRWSREQGIERGLKRRMARPAAALARARWSMPRPRVPKSGWTAATIRMAPPRSRGIADLEDAASGRSI